MEPLDNVGFVCPEHEPKPGKFKDKPPEEFLGKFVKLGFPVSKKDQIPRGPTVEHMWVKVLRLQKKKGKKEELVGRLDNDPFFVSEYAFEDEVGFFVEEIEDVVD